MSNLSSYHLGVVVVATHLKKKQTATVKSSQNRGEGFQQMVVFFLRIPNGSTPTALGTVEVWTCQKGYQVILHLYIHSEVTGVGFLYVVLIQTYLLRLGITGEVFIRRILSNCNWKDVSMIFLFCCSSNKIKHPSNQCNV